MIFDACIPAFGRTIKRRPKEFQSNKPNPLPPYLSSKNPFNDTWNMANRPDVQELLGTPSKKGEAGYDKHVDIAIIYQAGHNSAAWRISSSFPSTWSPFLRSALT